MVADGMGRINKSIDNVIVSHDVVDNLASVTQLQAKGLWVIMPPTNGCIDIGKDVGAFVLNDKGTVLAVADRKMVMDADRFGKTECDFEVTLPNILRKDDNGIDADDEDVDEETDYESDDDRVDPRLIPSKILKAYALPTGQMNVEQQVAWAHSIGHMNRDTMLFLANGGADNYYVTAEQIKKHMPVECEVCMKGTLQRRKITSPKINETPVEGVMIKKDDDVEAKDSLSYPDFSKKRIEQVNTTIGAQLGFDYFGPHYNVKVLTCTDKASGYMFSQALDKNDLKNAPEKLETAFAHYAAHGHHDKEYNKPIVEIRIDSDSTLLSKESLKLYQKHGVKVVASPPNEHRLNGLAEKTNQTLTRQVTKAFVGNPHVPEVLWPVAWIYETKLMNLHRSLLEGSQVTRVEEFTGRKPDFKETPYLPFGTVIEFPVSVRKSKFSERSHTGIFVNTSDTVKGAIHVYSFVTKKIVERTTYRILLRVPTAWQKIDRKFFTTALLDKEEAEELKRTEVNAIIGVDDPNKVVNHSAGAITVANFTPLATVNQVVPQQQAAVLSSVVPPVIPVVPNPEVVSLTHTPNVAVLPDVTVEASVDQLSLTPTVTAGSGHPSLVPPAIVPPANAAVPVHEGETGVINAQPSSRMATRSMRSAKQWKRERHKYGVRPINPLLMGMSFSADDDLHTNMLKHIKEVKLSNIKIDGKRTKWVKISKVEASRQKSKLIKVIRRAVRKTRSRDHPTLEEAKKRKDWPKFEEAIKAELDQLKKEGVFSDETFSYKDLVKEGIRVIGTMLVLQVKRKPNGSIDKYKARLVALGNQQEQNQYKEISSPTARSASVKCLIAIQAKIDAYSAVMDVKGAYLKSTVEDEDLYIRLHDGRIVKLQKYIYGLKQAGRKWNELLTSTLLACGYKQSVYDPSLFYRAFGPTDYVLMAIHVDDFYIVATKRAYIKNIHKELEMEFGEIAIRSEEILAYLGMEVDQSNPNYISLSQPGYLEKILEKAEIKDSAKSDVPYTENMVSQEGDDREFDKTRYLELIGMLNYIAVLTRPDILYALSRCAQKCSHPTEQDYRRVIKVFKYLNTTKDYQLRFTRGGDIKLQCYVDASHIHYPEDSKGHFGYTFSLGEGDATFYARSQKMKIVTPAGSTESEYVALYEAATEIVFLRNLLEELGFPQEGPTTIHEDNMSTIHMVQGHGKFHRQKHINVKYHYSRELLNEGVIRVEHCPTEDMVADILTKGGATKTVHRKLARKMLGMPP